MKRIIVIAVFAAMGLGLAPRVQGVNQIVTLSTNSTTRVQAYNGAIGLDVNAPLPGFITAPLDVAAGDVIPGYWADEVVTVQANGTIRIGNIDTGAYVHQLGAFGTGGDSSRVAIGDVDLTYPGKEMVTRTFYTGPDYLLQAYRYDPTGPDIKLDIPFAANSTGTAIPGFQDLAAGDLDSTKAGDEVAIVDSAAIRVYNLVSGAFVNSVGAFVTGDVVDPRRVAIGDVDLTKTGREVVLLGLNAGGAPILQVYDFLDPTESGYDIFLDFAGVGISGALDIAVGDIDPLTPGDEIVIMRDPTVADSIFVYNVVAGAFALNTSAMAALGANPFAVSIGQVIPEPSVIGLLALGGLIPVLLRRCRAQ